MNTTSIMRILRESRGYSQEYVGRVLGIEQNTYSKLESGQIKLTSARLCKLADLYEVSSDLLISNELPIVNYNNGKFSKGIVNNENCDPQQYKDFCEKLLLLKDQVIEEKEKQISILTKALEDKENENNFWKDFYLHQRK
jgi:transcriptional regulator with XRE-family HTH domain